MNNENKDTNKATPSPEQQDLPKDDNASSINKNDTIKDAEHIQAPDNNKETATDDQLPDSDDTQKPAKSIKDVIKEQEDAKKKVNLKDHHLLKKKQNRKSKMQGARNSRKNPFIQILDQHQAHKLRIAKVTAIVVLVLAAILITIFSLQKWQINQKKAELLNKVYKRLEEYDKQIKETEGYNKYLIALKATRLIDANYMVDSYKNYDKWVQLKNNYVGILQESIPEVKKNYVNANVLIDMVFIPQGRFNIGRKSDDKGNKSERPRHPIVIPYDFWMSRFEVTVSEYRMVNSGFRCNRWSSYRLDFPSQPVVRVSWHDAKEFCRVITSWAKKEGKLPDGYEYRLPTEAEWEYACKAGTDTTYYWGENFGNTGAKFANSLDRHSAKAMGYATNRFDSRVYNEMALNDGHIVSAPVGSYKPNAFGLYDMSGNVWEWCYDWYNPKAYSELPHTSPVQTDPVVNRLYEMLPFDAGKNYFDSTSKVIRGGSWGNVPFDLRSTNRDHKVPEFRGTGIGFRIVLSKRIDQLVPVPDKEVTVENSEK